jgi:hypothetical protein
MIGPTVALLGTLRAINRDQFVGEISVEVVRERDEARHTFVWSLFRPLVVGSQAHEVAGGFLASTSSPYRYNIFFVDEETHAEMDAILDPVRREWNERLIAAAPADDEAREALYRDFMQERVHYNAHAELARAL